MVTFSDTTASKRNFEAHRRAAGRTATDDDEHENNNSTQQTASGAASTTTVATGSNSSNNNTTLASDSVSRRPNDIVFQLNEPVSSIIPPSLEPSSAAFQTTPSNAVVATSQQQHDDDGSISLSNVLPMNTYNQAQRYLIHGALQAANFIIPQEPSPAPSATLPSSLTTTASTSTKATVAPRQTVSAQASSGVLQSAFAQAQQPTGGVSTAAYVNHFTRTLLNRGYAPGEGVSSLRPTPYVGNSASTYITTFVSAAIEDAPSENASEHIPTDEQRAYSSATLYDWNVSFQRSVRRNSEEFACAKGSRCWGMTLLDAHRRPLPKTVWPVFWFPEEMKFVRTSPEKMKAEAAGRFCIGCKFSDAADLANRAAMRNTRVGTNWVICNAHVLVNVPGEYPIELTQGLCSNGYRGLINQIPWKSRVGWTAIPDPDHNGCYLYRNENMVTFPIPPEYYHRDAPPMPLALAANQSAPASISVPNVAAGNSSAAANPATPRGF